MTTALIATLTTIIIICLIIIHYMYNKLTKTEHQNHENQYTISKLIQEYTQETQKPKPNTYQLHEIQDTIQTQTDQLNETIDKFIKTLKLP